MARINSNISSLIAQKNLSNANNDLQTHLERLSTGLRINRGADDPAGLIVSERLRSEISGINQAVDNSNRASSVIATTEGGLSEVSDLLSSIKGLIVQAANTGGVSDDERAANQLQIDSAIQSITRISNSTSFGGLKLLNGSLDYVLSGVQSTAISKASVTSANFAGKTNLQVDVQVLASAQTANIYLSAPSTGLFLSSTTLEISGPKGVQSIQIASGQTFSSVKAAINQFTESTGISATLIDPTASSAGLRFSSTTFGSDAFVNVRRLGGPASGGFFKTYSYTNNATPPATFSFSDPNIAAAQQDTGRDVSAIINGNLAKGKGLVASTTSQASISVELQLAQSFATAPGSKSTFYITGGGALYQIGGDINSSQQTNLGVQSVAASRLGGTLINGSLEFLDSVQTGGLNDLSSGNFDKASQVLDTAIDEVSFLRGRLGAFEKNTLQTNISSLQSSVENLTASESSIRDADFAAETSSLSRAQVLTSAATSVLQLANQQNQSVLKLLQ